MSNPTKAELWEKVSKEKKVCPSEHPVASEHTDCLLNSILPDANALLLLLSGLLILCRWLKPLCPKHWALSSKISKVQNQCSSSQFSDFDLHCWSHTAPGHAQAGSVAPDGQPGWLSSLSCLLFSSPSHTKISPSATAALLPDVVNCRVYFDCYSVMWTREAPKPFISPRASSLPFTFPPNVCKQL